MRILLVDDDPHLLEALALGLQLQWPACEVVTAVGGAAGERAFFDRAPDVVVLDVAPRDTSGLEVLRAIRRVSDVPVLVVTAPGEAPDQVRGLVLGADDYLVKPVGHLALLARIRAVLRRAARPPPARNRPDVVAGDLAVHFQRRQVTLRGEPVPLTAVEYTLLAHLARHAGRRLPPRALLDRVWGADAGATPRHLEAVVDRLRAKLEPAGGPRFIESEETERGVGYRFVRPRHLRAAARPARRPRPPGPPARDRRAPGRRHRPAMAGGRRRGDRRPRYDARRAAGVVPWAPLAALVRR
jgi:DNA-binding response OmpR family regulator